MSKSMIASNKPLKYGKIAFAALLALTFCMAHPASTAYAKKRKKVNYGTIRILSTPGGFPVSVDGKSFGETSTNYQSMDLDPGLHTIVISLPNGQLCSRDIDLRALRSIPAGRGSSRA